MKQPLSTAYQIAAERSAEPTIRAPIERNETWQVLLIWCVFVRNRYFIASVFSHKSSKSCNLRQDQVGEFERFCARKNQLLIVSQTCCEFQAFAVEIRVHVSPWPCASRMEGASCKSLFVTNCNGESLTENVRVVVCGVCWRNVNLS